MSILKDLEQDIKEHVVKAGYNVEKLAMERSNRRDLGEYQLNDAMQLAKIYKKNPREIAQRIVNELEKDSRFININIAGPGFINISLSDKYIYEYLNKIDNNIYSNIDKKQSKKIIIDYGGANVSKALHVGHLRSANLGEALKRLSKLLGYEVLGDAHLGDYGRPLGLVILEIKKMYPELPFFNHNYKGDYEEIPLPITNEDLEKIYPIASQKAKDDPDYLDEARIITTKIQSHERGYYDLWKRIINISKADIKEVYNSLNVYFDLWLGESDAAEYFEQLNEILTKKKILEESAGAKIIDVSEETDKAPVPPLLFVKSNGTISYETTDLATILQRKIEINPDEIWYCIDNRQELHFKQVFRATRKAQLIDDNVKLEFIGFGTMNGKDGKPFKTRDGGVMTLKALISLVTDEIIKRINSTTIPEGEKIEIAKKVAIGALKYADFLPYRGTDYIFEIEKFADLDGKTGPYLLYSTIRMKSLLKKTSKISAKKITKLKGKVERDIAIEVLNLPLVLNKSLETKSLNDIAEYLYKITSLYNNFYAENKVLSEKNEEIQSSWIVLTRIIYNINVMLLDILGIEVPDKM